MLPGLTRGVGTGYLGRGVEDRRTELKRKRQELTSEYERTTQPENWYLDEACETNEAAVS